MTTNACFVAPVVMRLNGVPWVWDDMLSANTLLRDFNGVWHIGRGTDLKELEAKLNELAAKKEGNTQCCTHTSNT